MLELSKSFLEAIQFEVDKICQEDHFDCPACSPDMLAVWKQQALQIQE